MSASNSPILHSSRQASSWGDWTATLGSFTQFFGLSSLFAALFSHAYLFDSAKLLILGSIIEAGRRLCQWLIERFRFREFSSCSLLRLYLHTPTEYSMTAQFDEGDPAYEWIVLFLVCLFCHSQI
jgi:mitochondrial chaperone BCS1